MPDLDREHGDSAVQAEYGSGSTGASCTPTSAGATTVAATVGQTTSGINAAMNTGAQLTGTVTRADTGANLSSITVTAYDSSGDFLGETSSATNGTYSLDALPAGTYKVGFSDGSYYKTYLPQYYNGQPSLAAADSINLTTAQTLTGINAAVQDGGQITGTVTDAATHQALTNVYVTAYDSSGNYVGYAYSNSSGAYTLTGLGTGSYRVEFNSFAGGYVSEYYNGKGSLSTADPVAVSRRSDHERNRRRAVQWRLDQRHDHRLRRRRSDQRRHRHRLQLLRHFDLLRRVG